MDKAVKSSAVVTVCYVTVRGHRTILVKVRTYVSTVLIIVILSYLIKHIPNKASLMYVLFVQIIQIILFE